MNLTKNQIDQLTDNTFSLLSVNNTLKVINSIRWNDAGKLSSSIQLVMDDINEIHTKLYKTIEKINNEHN